MTLAQDYSAALERSPAIQSNTLLTDWCNLTAEARAAINDSARALSKTFSVDPLFDRLNAEYPNQISLLTKTGVHPFKKCDLVNPFTGSPLHDDFSNIGRHSIAVAGPLDILAGDLVAAGRISEKQRRSITIGGILHDASKPIDIYARIAIKEGAFDRQYFESNKTALIAQWLHSLDITDEERESITQANEATGVENLVRDYAKVDHEGVLSLITPEWTRALIRLVDDCVSSVSSPVETHRLLPSLSRCDLADTTHTKYVSFWNGALAYTEGKSLCHILEIPQIGKPIENTYFAKPITNVFQLEVSSVELLAEEVRQVLSPKEPILRGTKWLCSYLESKL